MPQWSSRRIGWTGFCREAKQRTTKMLCVSRMIISWYIGRVAGTQNWWLLERWRWPETIRTMDQFESIHNTESCSTFRIYVVGERLTRIRPSVSKCGQKYGQTYQRILCRKKNSNGQKKSGSSTMPEDRDDFFKIAPEDLEFEEIIKNARRKLESHEESVLPCESRREVHSKDDKIQKTIYEHKIEAHESQRCRIQEDGKRDHECRIADSGHNSMNHYNLVRNPIPIHQEKDTGCKSRCWQKVGQVKELTSLARISRKK